MHITSLHYTRFRRFTNLTVSSLPPNTRLVILAGPNGTGKSSVFDGMRVWQGRFIGQALDPLYHDKAELTGLVPGGHNVDVVFDQPISDVEVARRAVYIRTAYRHEADFSLGGFGQLPRLLDLPRPHKMIEQETTVSQNYQQLVGQTMASLFDASNDGVYVEKLRGRLIGDVREAMRNVFGDLVLQGFNDPISSGTFFFEKGTTKGWPYKNLSGGEKAAFDLLLDVIVKRAAYTDTVYCIDEPETHLNTRVQGRLLRELLRLIPDPCQLWIASHSIGMMREAWRMHEESEPVAFLEFGDKDYDEPVTLQPVTPDRRFWQNMLSVAVGDLADLVAPREVVLVEGKPKTNGHRGNVEFDARCLRTIFGDARPQAGFVSVSGSNDVQSDRLALGGGLQALVPGASVIRLIDRDDRSDQEMATLETGVGVKVLPQRDLENYLLADELLQKLCDREGKPTVSTGILSEKQRLLTQNIQAGKPADDVKGISGQLYNHLKKTLSLTQAGSTTHAFLSDTMASLVTPDTKVFKELQAAIFD